MEIQRRSARIRKAIAYAALTAAAVVVLFPFFWMIVTAFKEPGQEFSRNILPNPPTLENFRRVLSDYGFGRYFANSVIVATVSAAFATLFATLAGYVFAKKDLRVQGQALRASPRVAHDPGHDVRRAAVRHREQARLDEHLPGDDRASPRERLRALPHAAVHDDHPDRAHRGGEDGRRGGVAGLPDA